MTKSRKNLRVQSGGVGAASPHLEGAQRPDQSGPDESGTDPAAEARRADLPPEGAPRGGRKIAVDSPIAQSMECLTPEVSERPVRRQFTAEYKLRILRELDACKELGDVGRALRREGLYSSLVSCWRQQRDRGSVAELAPKRRGRKVEPANPLAAKYALLERMHRKLEKKLQRAELLLDIQKKIADLLGISLEKPEVDEVP